MASTEHSVTPNPPPIPVSTIVAARKAAEPVLRDALPLDADGLDQPLDDLLTAAAPIIAATELTRMAARLSTAGHVTAAAALLARVDELAPR